MQIKFLKSLTQYKKFAVAHIIRFRLVVIHLFSWSYMYLAFYVAKYLLRVISLSALYS